MAQKIKLPMSELGPELYYRRIKRGLSIQKMTEITGNILSRQFLYQIEVRRIMPSPDKFAKLVKFYAENPEDEKKLWRLFRETKAIKLTENEFEYMSGLLSFVDPEDREKLINIIVLEGDKIRDYCRYHRLKLINFLKNKKIYACVEFYSSLSISSEKKFDFNHRNQELFEELNRWMHPLTSTIIAVSENEDYFVGYILLRISDEMYRWFWLEKEDVRHILELIKLCRREKIIEPSYIAKLSNTI